MVSTSLPGPLLVVPGENKFNLLNYQFMVLTLNMSKVILRLSCTVITALYFFQSLVIASLDIYDIEKQELCIQDLTCSPLTNRMARCVFVVHVYSPAPRPSRNTRHAPWITATAGSNWL